MSALVRVYPTSNSPLAAAGRESFDDSATQVDIAPKERAHAAYGDLIAGKYRVLEVIGRGGMGAVYRAEQLPLGRTVALKVVSPPRRGSRHKFQRRFLREAATCARLSHPNTVAVYDYGQVGDDGQLYMAMELLEGRTLYEAIREEGCFNVKRAVRIAWEICRSIRQAHSLGIVHRDLKPENIMLTRTDMGEGVKILDFGVAKLLSTHWDPEASLTAKHKLVGTPAYMSPEQFQFQPVDQRSDVYAVGLILYEMLTGQPPFCVHYQTDWASAHVGWRVPTMAERTGVTVPADVEAVVHRCLEKRPADRVASANDLMSLLQQSQPFRHGSVPIAAEDTLEPVATPAAHSRRAISTHSHSLARIRKRPLYLRWGITIAIALAMGVAVAAYLSRPAPSTRVLSLVTVTMSKAPTQRAATGVHKRPKRKARAKSSKPVDGSGRSRKKARGRGAR